MALIALHQCAPNPSSTERELTTWVVHKAEMEYIGPAMCVHRSTLSIQLFPSEICIYSFIYLFPVEAILQRQP